MAQHHTITATIPKIIHQTWKTGDIPVEWQQYAQSWKKFHQNWQYQLWTDEDNKRFVEEHYRDFLETYEGYSYNIQRADAIRYLILYKYGGGYVDLDSECLRSVDNLVAGRSFIMGREPENHARWHGEEDLVSNAFMASQLPGIPSTSA